MEKKNNKNRSRIPLDLFTKKQAAAYLRLSISQLQYAIKMGDLPAPEVAHGGRNYYKKSTLEKIKKEMS